MNLDHYGKHFLLLLLQFTAVYVNAQDKCDCKEAKTLRPKIGSYFNSGKLDSAAIVLEQLNKPGSEACMIVYLDGIGQVHVAKKQFTEARSIFKKEEQLQKALGCKKMMVRFYNTMARYYQETGHRDSVSIVTLKAIELAEEEKEWYAAARACTNLASIFEQENQYEKQLNYNRKGIPFARRSKDTVILAAILTRTASAYYNMYLKTQTTEYLDSVYLMASECIAISRDKPANLLEFSDALYQLSTYYFKKNQQTTALQYADSAIMVCPPGVFDFYRHLVNGYEAKSEIFFAQKNYTNSRAMADSAFHYAALFNIQLAVTPLETIYNSSKQLNDFERAVWAHEKMTAIKDSIYTLQKTATINELEKKYNQARNEKTISELSLQKKIYLLLAVAALLGIGTIGFFLRQQSLKHKQKTLETEQRLNRARMNPHFFFNALSSLQSFALKKNDSKAIAVNLAKFSGLMRETLESTYNDYVTIEEETEYLKHYLDLQLIRYEDKFSYRIETDEELETDELLVPSMIIQPFVENSIEHGFSNISYKGTITVHFSKKEKELQITIADNGKGFSNEKTSTGTHISRAGQIVKERIHLLNLKHKTKARFTIDEGKEKGVVVKIILPEIYKR